jgi:uncharacterized protein
MPDSVIETIVVITLLLLSGTVLGQMTRCQFSFRWLLASAGLVLLNDTALTNGFGAIPELFSASAWNWQGKILAVIATLAVASYPSLGWRRAGLTLTQNSEGRPTTYLVALVLCLLFAGLAVSSPNEALDVEALAFQLTMPGLDEEPYYRGILLLALNEAFRGRIRMLGINLSWGGILSCAMFGMAHAFEYSEGAFSFDAMTMVATAIPSFALLWMRERTGSLVLPIVLHNFANSIGHIL